jgi:hypothetical protein
LALPDGAGGFVEVPVGVEESDSDDELEEETLGGGFAAAERFAGGVPAGRTSKVGPVAYTFVWSDVFTNATWYPSPTLIVTLVIVKLCVAMSTSSAIEYSPFKRSTSEFTMMMEATDGSLLSDVQVMVLLIF